MKRTIPLILSLLLVGCASDPVVTGKPQHWRGKLAADLKATLGEPTRIIKQSSGDEVWEYTWSGDFTVPKGENTSFRFGAGSVGSTAGFTTEKRPEDRTSREVNLWRFKIHKGKVGEWYASRSIDGRIVWQDH